MRKFISYLRVSTKRQGESGLGLEAQREAITTYLNGGDWELLSEHVEIESGKKSDRPILQEALTMCQLTGATLIVAKLDRLARDAHFISSLQKAGTEFIICDFPAANKMMIGILALIAEYERDMICARTKAALARSTKPKGVRALANLTKNSGAAAEGRRLGGESMRQKANEFALRVYPIITHYQQQGLTTDLIAVHLNTAKIKTARGKVGTWSALSVSNILKRGRGLVEKSA